MLTIPWGSTWKARVAASHLASKSRAALEARGSEGSYCTAEAPPSPPSSWEEEAPPPRALSSPPRAISRRSRSARRASFSRRSRSRIFACAEKSEMSRPVRVRTRFNP
eukprot:466881-Prorocentrum_minimum.AAC.9